MENAFHYGTYQSSDHVTCLVSLQHNGLIGSQEYYLVLLARYDELHSPDDQ